MDGNSKTAISPVDSLVLSIAGCMGSDVVHILEKSRVDLTGLEIEAEAPRAEENPRRLIGLRMTFRLEGPTAEDRAKVERAVELSRTTYCSVLHTLDPNLDATFEIEMA
jgi:putative redox protein